MSPATRSDPVASAWHLPSRSARGRLPLGGRARRLLPALASARARLPSTAVSCAAGRRPACTMPPRPGPLCSCHGERAAGRGAASIPRARPSELCRCTASRLGAHAVRPWRSSRRGEPSGGTSCRWGRTARLGVCRFLRKIRVRWHVLCRTRRPIAGEISIFPRWRPTIRLPRPSKPSSPFPGACPRLPAPPPFARPSAASRRPSPVATGRWLISASAAVHQEDSPGLCPPLHLRISPPHHSPSTAPALTSSLPLLATLPSSLPSSATVRSRSSQAPARDGAEPASH